MSVLAFATIARADTAAFNLSSGSLTQDWTNLGLITANDSWSGVASIEGYRGDGGASGTGVNPTTVTADLSGVIDVNANQTNPDTFTTGGVTEFHIANPVVALAGSGTARAPNIVFALNTTSRMNITFACNLRDIDASADDAAQPIAVQYRVGGSGAYTNIAGGYFPDVTTASSATQVTPVSLTLPSDANNSALVQIRVITTDAVGNDEWIGIDDISITSSPISTGPVCGNGMIESGEQCDGGACCNPTTCQFQASSVVCRAQANECDVAELCTGTSAACPATDAAVAPGTACGDSGFGGGGPVTASCDAPDTCAGTVGATAVCVDNFQPPSVVCRVAVSDCDAAEFCTGTGPTCPVVDAAQPPGTVCGAMPSGVCDAPDVCQGTEGFTATCAARVQPNTTVCRSIAGPCDVVDRCDGSGTSCPADAFLDGSNVCRPSAGVCDSAEQCTGASAACPTDSVLAIGTLCRASTGTCDPAESCNGFATCPADRSAPDGTACGDGTTCDGAETCQMGSCLPGTPLSCDDRNACTADACAEPGGCQNNAIAGCCNIDGDCSDDGDVCTTERCSGTGGTCESLPITGCCTDDSDCSGGTACLAVSCNLGTNRCETTPVMGCCDADADCDDSVSCTRDTCNTTTGACSNTDIVGCCVGTADCDDGDECTTDRCSSGTCAATAIDGCCLGDSDCTEGDGDACTAPSCNVATERCTETAISCDDADGCTADACEADGSCSHTDISCDDGDECTADSCAAGACEHTDIVGCGMTGDAGMMTDDAGMMTDDAGMMVGMDAALPDAGFTNDAASLRTDVPVDAGSISNVDAGLGNTDAGPLDVDESGCSCSVPGTRTTSRDHWLALGVIGLLVAGLRRRRR
ncbi:MAG: hypothetical protein J0L92_17370 [Deltaproteobacteria bacterium]|nr:hypothetical protein [Deltaproteobacteria bacterium]